MSCWVLVLVAGQVPFVEDETFSRKLQTQVVNATVHVRNPQHQKEGSGVVVGRKGTQVYILTARHLVIDVDQVEIATYSSDTYPRQERVYRKPELVADSNHLTDLALLRLSTPDTVTVPLQIASAKLAPTEKTFLGLSSGCSSGAAPTCRTTQIEGAKRVSRTPGGDTALVWEVAQKQESGRSGGPLVDRHGLVVGICTGNNRDKGYFCHAEEIEKFLRKNGFAWLVGN